MLVLFVAFLFLGNIWVTELYSFMVFTLKALPYFRKIFSDNVLILFSY